MIRLCGLITASRLRKLLAYDPETGVFTNLVWRSSNAPAGAVAGSPNCRGYQNIHIDGSRYLAHRLAWLYMTGEWPKDRIDHRDTDNTNNRWLNLREATQSQNVANAKKRFDNTSGYKGVGWSHSLQKWRAEIKVNHRRVHLGVFDQAEDAHVAYILASKHFFGDFARAQ